MDGCGTACIEKMVKMGISVAYPMFDWGYAPEIEREDWDCFRKFTELCHENDIAVVAYVQPSNIVWEDWFRLHPESKDWLCIDKDGKWYTYFGVGGRYMCCFNNPDRIEQVGEMTLKSVEYGADSVFYDNIVLFPCYCSYCKEGFAGYLEANSISPVDFKDIHEYDAGDEYWRHWCRFRSQSINKFYQAMQKAVTTDKTKIPITSNTGFVVGKNVSANYGCDFEQIAKLEDYIFVETRTLPAMFDRGLINNARSIKVSDAPVGNKMVMINSHGQRQGLGGSGTYTSVYKPREYQLGMAEAAAWQGTMLVTGTEFFDEYWTLLTEDRFNAQHEAIGQYNRFFAEHQELYEGNRYLANIGLCFSSSSLTWTRENSFPSFCGFFQTLYQNNIPFHILLEEDIKKGRFRDCELIILPNVCCIDEATLDKLAAFNNEGGRLLITGEFGIRDTSGNTYKSSLLNRLSRGEGIMLLKDCPGWLGSEHDSSGLYWHFQLPEKSENIVKTVKEEVDITVLIHTNTNNIVAVWERDDGYIIHIVNFDEGTGAESEIILPHKLETVKGFSPDSSLKGRLDFRENKVTVKQSSLYDVIRCWR